MIKSFRKKQAGRIAVKKAREVIKHARHVKNYFEDIAKPSQIAKLDEMAVSLLRKIREKGTSQEITAIASETLALATEIVPNRRFRGLRDNLEVILVALVVAMGIRTYFIQPFKIPTGSMQPTLYGIHGFDMDKPEITDKFPLKFVRWIITGERYREVRILSSGRLLVQANSRKPGFIECHVDRHVYFVPRSDRDSVLRRQGKDFATGEVLWSGRQKTGDHVFVNKMAWNFFRPKRGDVMVFNTDGITELESDFPRDRRGRVLSTHYIKRLCALPGETVSIQEPYLIVDGAPVISPESVARVASRSDGYHGYVTAGIPNLPLGSPHTDMTLGPDEFLALGDNTTNSKDSRYWGAVPRRNLVGPASVVYWPYTKGRWGRIQGH